MTVLLTHISASTRLQSESLIEQTAKLVQTLETSFERLSSQLVRMPEPKPKTKPKAPRSAELPVKKAG
jgi:hypothetical protein